MALTLYHHPWSRAAGTVWSLEEVGEPYELEFLDLMAGEHKSEAHRRRNQMAKIPVLRDDDVVIAENAAIGVYLADRYALGRLSPELDDPRRGPFLRWCFFAPSVVEPACMAKGANWDYKPSSAGFGSYEDMLATLEFALAEGPYLLGEQFTIADVILGGTIRFMLDFNMMERGEHIGPYADRLAERPALQRANEINERIIEERNITSG